MKLVADQTEKYYLEFSLAKDSRDTLYLKADSLYRIRILIRCNLCLQTSDLLFVVDLFQNLPECLEGLHQSQ